MGQVVSLSVTLFFLFQLNFTYYKGIKLDKKCYASKER